MPDFFMSIIDTLNATQVPAQIRGVDIGGLFTNPFFILPFLGLVGYLLYKQSFNNLILIGIAIGLWIFSGTSFMQGLVVDGEMQIGKVLPVAGVGLVALAVAVYLLFMRE